MRKQLPLAWLGLIALAAVLPPVTGALDFGGGLMSIMPVVFIYGILAVSLNIVVGCTGLLHLGLAGLFAIGAYALAILTSSSFPFQMSFWAALPLAVLSAAAAGYLLGYPTLRLRGDYVAIATLGFGEVVVVALKNLEGITLGAKGINPIGKPAFGSFTLSPSQLTGWYYLTFAALALVAILTQFLSRSATGRAWMAVREDELAARSMGVDSPAVKLGAFVLSAAGAGLAGALWASFQQSTGEPGNYSFNVSVILLCMVIIGGMGSVRGAILGAALLQILDFHLLPLLGEKLRKLLALETSSGSLAYVADATNWRWFIFGLALILTVHWRPEGLWPATREGAVARKEGEG